MKEDKQPITALTYKQLAQNFKEDVQKNVRQAIRRANKEKTQIRIVNKPGSIIKGPEGTFMITSKGKSLRIGD